MRCQIFAFSCAVLLLAGGGEAGLTHRRLRNALETTAAEVATPLAGDVAPIAAELRTDQIPVAVVALQDQPLLLAVESLAPVQSESKVETAPVAIEAAPIEKAPQAEIQPKAELEAEKTQPAAEDIPRKEATAPAAGSPPQEAVIYEEIKLVEPQPEPAAPIAIEQQLQTLLKAVPLDSDAAQLPAVVQPEVVDIVKVVPVVGDDVVAVGEVVSSVRQSAAPTPATPGQPTTQQNFVQQLLQNNPVGQFISSLTGQQQQQQAAGVAADEPATPGPTLPGFLNPGNAITSAQQAVQGFVNQTQQAFQGIQQFATNLNSQFQNTLSNLGGQGNAQTTADSTTPRPPGPLQGIISFFQGGNQNRPLQQDTPVAQPTTLRPAAAIDVNDKIDNTKKKDEAQSAVAPATVEAAAAEEATAADIAPTAAAVPNAADNEVRSSGEVSDDSFEEATHDELIVVDDDAAQRDTAVPVVAAVAA